MILDLRRKVFFNKGNAFQYIATLAGACSIMISGINLAWTSPYLPKLMSNSSSIPTTSEEGSWCATAPLLGAPVGAIGAVFLADRIGRKYTALLMTPIVTVCFVLIALATSIWEITAYRLIIGATEGASYTVLPMYIGEISDPEIRGFLAATISIFAIVGTLFINVIGPWMDIFTSSLVCASIPVIHFILFAFMPESPYYHIKKKNHAAARDSLEILRGRIDVDDEMEGLCSAVTRQERDESTGILDLFSVPSTRKACFIFLVVCLTSKFSGKNPCLSYTKTIFKESGSTINPTLSVIIYCGVELIAVIISSFFIVDRFGKRLLMIISTTGCSISVFTLGLYLYFKDYHVDIVQDLYWLPITALVSYNVLFSMGLAFGPVLVLSELFPTNVKAKALGIADTFSVLMGALVNKFFQVSMDEFGTMSVPFLFFAVCSVVGLGFIVKFLPETKGKTLEEIQQYLIGKKACGAVQMTREFRI